MKKFNVCSDDPHTHTPSNRRVHRKNKTKSKGIQSQHMQRSCVVPITGSWSVHPGGSLTAVQILPEFIPQQKTVDLGTFKPVKGYLA